MDLKLHANATTTPRVRAYIRKSQATNAALARELGIHSRTVARWKARQEVTDRSTRPHRLNTSLREWGELAVNALCRPSCVNETSEASKSSGLVRRVTFGWSG